METSRSLRIGSPPDTFRPNLRIVEHVKTGDVIGGRYRLERELGRGGMGTVYLAQHIYLGRPTAVKVLRPALYTDEAAEERFRREAMFAARIAHPSVAQVYDFDRTEDGEFVLAMEFVKGETVAERLRRRGPFSTTDAIAVLITVADGLDRAHGMGILHRDIKPENVMIGASGLVKLLDFGIARPLDTSSITSGGFVVGTPVYMSPEQLLGETLTSATDIYSLGVLFYEMLTRQLPHNASTADELRVLRLSERPTPLHRVCPDCPRALADVVARCLAAEPGARWPSAGSFARAAAEAAAQPVPPPPSPPRHPGRASDAIDRWEAHFEALRFAGRDRQIRMVRDTWAAARAGTTTVLWVEGDEGAGKSSFAELARREAATDGAGQLLGRGYDGEVARPYGPWIPMLRTALTFRGAAGRQWPGVQALTDAIEATPVPESGVLFDEISALLYALANHSPLFVGLEDLDACDPASISLFEFLCSDVSGVPLLLATSADVRGTQRAARSRRARERLRHLRRVVWVTLHPLGYEAVRAWLAHGLGDDPSDTLMRFVYGHTEGNPFFIEQIVRWLADQGELERLSDERAIELANAPAPQAVADVISRRLGTMSSAAQELLQIAAVVGREFDVELVLDLCDWEEDAALDALDEAVAAGALVPVKRGTDDWYRFTHGKIGDVLAQTMNPRRRRRLHAQVAEALARRPQAAPGSLAWHWYHAGEKTRAWRHAVRAARQALAVHDYDDALTFGVLAGEVSTNDAETRDAHELRGDALWRLHRHAEAAAAYAHARLLAGADAPMTALRCKELRTSLSAGARAATGAVAEAEELVQLSEGDPDTVPAAQLALAEALLATGNPDEAIVHAQKVRIAASESGNRFAAGDALLALGQARLDQGDLTQAATVANEARTLFEEIGDAYCSARAALLRGAVAAAAGDEACADDAYRDASFQAERAGITGLVRRLSGTRHRLPG